MCLLTRKPAIQDQHITTGPVHTYYGLYSAQPFDGYYNINVNLASSNRHLHKPRRVASVQYSYGEVSSEAGGVIACSSGQIFCLIDHEACPTENAFASVTWYIKQ